MDILIHSQNSYLSSTFRRDLAGAGKVAGSSAEEEQNGGNLAAQSADTVEISEHARTLQRILSGKEARESKNDESEQDVLAKRQSRLQNALEGKEDVSNDTRLAYGGTGKAAQSEESSESADLAARIRDLQKQLRSATKRLNEAYRELSEAQAKNIDDEARAVRRGENPDLPQDYRQEQAQDEVRAAQQKITSSQAEINTVQEQLQKLLREQAQAAGGNDSSTPNVSVGGSWQPQGTNDYIGGNW